METNQQTEAHVVHCVGTCSDTFVYIARFRRFMQSEPEFAASNFLHPSSLTDGLFTLLTFSASEQRKTALTHVMLVVGGVLIRQHTTINTIVPVVVTTDDSDHTRDWGTSGLMVIHLLDWLYNFIYCEMLAWRLCLSLQANVRTVAVIRPWPLPATSCYQSCCSSTLFGTA